MAADTPGQFVYHLPTQGKFAQWLFAQVLSGDLQCVFRHDFVRALPNFAEWRVVGHCIVYIEQQQASELRRRLPLPPHLLGNKMFIRTRRALIFNLFHLVA